MKIDETFVFLQVCFGEPVDGTRPPFRRVNIETSTEYPIGRRGLLLANCWKSLAVKNTSGMLMMDGDIVIDPCDLDGMFQVMKRWSDDVITAPVRIWPVSTQRPTWSWGHRHSYDNYKHWQENVSDPDMFSLSFTYIPRRLIEASMPDLKDWVYPHVDVGFGEVAKKEGIPVHVADNCWPKHCNY